MMQDSVVAGLETWPRAGRVCCCTSQGSLSDSLCQDNNLFRDEQRQWGAPSGQQHDNDSEISNLNM